MALPGGGPLLANHLDVPICQCHEYKEEKLIEDFLSKRRKLVQKCSVYQEKLYMFK